MHLYVGLPICFDTAAMLFGTDDLEEIERKVSSVGLVFVGIDKGVSVLGSEVRHIHICDETYRSVDDGLRFILEAKKRVTEGFKRLKLDLSDFEIEKMESDPIRVSFPEPFLISV